MEPHRAERLAEALRSEIEEILNYELNDPRMTAVAVTEVILSPDGRKARVRVRAEGSAEEAARTLEVIETAKGYIRRLAAERVDIFRAPELRFEPDVSPELAEKAGEILRRVRKGRPRDEGGAPASEKNPHS